MSRRTAAALVAAAALAGGCLDAPPPLEPELAAPAALPTVAATAAPTVPATASPASGGEAPATETRGSEPPVALRRSSAERAARELTLRVRVSGCGQLLTGSGFAIADDVLVTNRHVVEGGTQVEVSTWDGRTVSAAFVTAAFEHDIAIVRLDAPVPRSATLAEQDPVPGDPVTVVGFPGGGEQELSDGEVVGYVTAISQGREIHSLQLTAPAAPGSSGGPVLDADGRVAGVVYALEIETGHTLAMPASTLRATFAGDGDMGAPVRC